MKLRKIIYAASLVTSWLALACSQNPPKPRTSEDPAAQVPEGEGGNRELVDGNRSGADTTQGGQTTQQQGGGGTQTGGGGTQTGGGGTRTGGGGTQTGGGGGTTAAADPNSVQPQTGGGQPPVVPPAAAPAVVKIAVAKPGVATITGGGAVDTGKACAFPAGTQLRTTQADVMSAKPGFRYVKFETVAGCNMNEGMTREDAWQWP